MPRESVQLAGHSLLCYHSGSRERRGFQKFAFLTFAFLARKQHRTSLDLRLSGELHWDIGVISPSQWMLTPCGYLLHLEQEIAPLAYGSRGFSFIRSGEGSPPTPEGACASAPAGHHAGRHGRRRCPRRASGTSPTPRSSSRSSRTSRRTWSGIRGA